MEQAEYAETFLHMIVAGDIDEAYERFVDMNGTHHNPYFPAGFLALKEAMKEQHAAFPHKKLIIKHIVSQDDLVFVHSHLIIQEGKEMRVVHMMRIVEGKITEMWDCAQPLPEESPNSDGAF